MPRTASCSSPSRLPSCGVAAMHLARACSTGGSAIPGLLLLLAGLFTYLVGQLGADVFLTRVSLVVVASGALWFACGTACMRVAAAPLLFLLLAVPLPALVANAVTLPMQLTASQIAEHTLTVAGVAVFRDGNVLELPSGSLEVAQACSGLRSAVSLGAIAVLLAWTQPTWPRRAAIVLASLPIAIVMNGLRITAQCLRVRSVGARGRNRRLAHLHRLGNLCRVARPVDAAAAGDGSIAAEARGASAGGNGMKPTRLAVAIVLVASTAVLARAARRTDAVRVADLSAFPVPRRWVGGP